MIAGYAGKTLFVNLTTGKIEKRETPQNLVKQFIGGYSFGARVLYDLMKPGIDPLGNENVLGFVTGPLTGTGALFSGRYAVVCKSPVSGTWNDANSGGFFGPEFKRAGYDAVFVIGRAERPVYLWINDGRVEIRNAEKLWGQNTEESLSYLCQETGEEKLRAAIIGRAGELRSLLACVINDGHRAAARGGLGAVMGSKNLKAIAVRGTGKILVANPSALKELNIAIIESMQNGPMASIVDAFKQWGTGLATGGSILLGDMPVKNWGGVGIVDINEVLGWALSAGEMDKSYKTETYRCANCPLHCGALYKNPDGSWSVGETGRPEYETVAAFGPNTGNTNVEAILKCNDICNLYGMDTIATGATIAWAIECFQEGVINKEDTSGIELNWGDPEMVCALTQDIAEQKGFGKILALGSARAAEQLGKGAEYLHTVRGIELPMHDPRNAPGYARTYQFDPTPGRHVKGGLGQSQITDFSPGKYDPKGKGLQDLEATLQNELVDITGLCQFSLLTGVNGLAGKMLQAVTGWDISGTELRRIGLRSLFIRQAFNLREGFVPADFKLPNRAVGKPPQTEGPHAGVTVPHEALAKEFFNAVGWDQKTGKPKRAVLKEIGGFEDILDEVALPDEDLAD